MEPPPPAAFLVLSLVFANLFFAPGASTSGENNILRCLTDQFKRSKTPTTDTIFTPSNSSYAYLQQYENLRATSAYPLKPLLIITPHNATEIRATIYCSQKLDIQIRVRCGGHDYEGLSYTCREPFVILDMRNLRSVTIGPNGKSAWVQTGATLGELYYALANATGTGTVSAGVCPTVGVGGHLSGGGYGMISRKYGLASDNIVDAKLMVVDGKILDRRSMGEDVFWALRGGGSASFGVILAFKVTLVTVPKTVTAFEVVRMSDQNVTRLVLKWQSIAHTFDEDLVLRVSLNSVKDTSSGNRTIAAYFNALYLGGADDLVSLMGREFPELELKKTDCNEMSWIDSVLFFASLKNRRRDALLIRVPQSPFTPSFYKGKSDFVTRPIPEDCFPEIWKFLHKEAAHRGALEFSPFGGVLSDYSENESPFAHRAGMMFMIRYGVTWDKDGDGEDHVGWISELYEYMSPYVSSLPRRAYFNYKDLDIGMNNDKGNTSYSKASVWGHKYYKDNFARLVRAKNVVDPSNFFRNEQSIPL